MPDEQNIHINDLNAGNANIGGTQHIENLTINNYHNIQPDEP